MDNNRVPRVHGSSPPSPPFISYVAALAIVMLIFICISVFSIIVPLLMILLALYIASALLCWFVCDRRELDAEMGERTFYAQTPQNNQRAGRFLDRLSWVAEERGNKRLQGLVEKLLGSVVYFESQAMASGCSDCAICLEDFEKGEECQVFPVCGHLFHSSCLSHWLEKKLTCPICRRPILFIS